MSKAASLIAGSVALAFFAGGCATQTAPDEAFAEAPEAAIGQTASPLVAFNPCHPDWQLPTDARRYLDETDGEFLRFEDRLEAGGARWIGSFELAKPFRAIVRVDHYLSGTKQSKKGLWYLAAVPVGSTDAVAAIREFEDTFPVNSRALGYCLAGGGFMLNNGSGPGNAIVKQVIVEYDPRCVCTSSTALVNTWVSWATYEAIPVP